RRIIQEVVVDDLDKLGITVGLRPTASTRSMPGSIRHSRKTPCPTMPVTPKMITCIGTSQRRRGLCGGRDLVEGYTGQRRRDIPQHRSGGEILRLRHDFRRHRWSFQFIKPVRTVIAAGLYGLRGRGEQGG